MREVLQDAQRITANIGIIFAKIGPSLVAELFGPGLIGEAAGHHGAGALREF